MMLFFCPNKSRIRWSIGFAGIIAASTLIGCISGVSNVEPENTLAIAAYNSTQCATAAAVQGFYGAYTWNSPSNYATSCNAIDDTSLGTANLSGYGSSTKYVGSKTACEATEITSLFYIKMPSGGAQVWTLIKTESHAGVWTQVLGIGRCNIQSTSFPAQESDVKVRVATTVRQTSGSSFITLPFTTYLK